MGGYCPDKLMSLKQQARLRSLGARAEHNLQEKWREKQWSPQRPGRHRSSGDRAVLRTSLPMDTGTHGTDGTHAGSGHGIGIRHGSPWGRSLPAIPAVEKSPWSVRSARARDTKAKAIAKQFPPGWAVSGLVNVNGETDSTRTCFLSGKTWSNSGGGGDATSSYLPGPPKGWLLHGRDSGCRPTGQERGCPHHGLWFGGPLVPQGRGL